jgi:two-component system cell cycle response regulator
VHLSFLLSCAHHWTLQTINDTHGHDAGDYVLRELCSVISSSHLRKGDVFARYGGEEFVMLLPKTTLPVALEHAEQLRAGVMAHDFEYEGTKIKVTVSVGAAQLSEDVATSAQIIKAADKALYRAKSGGRNKVVAHQ